jgi:hypothetical protein
MKTQTTEQHPVSVGIPPKAIFHNESRKDNQSFAWLRLGVVCAMATALTLTVSVARAQNAYEHFDYPVGAIGGQNGGAGWAGPWTGSGNNVVLQPTGESTVVCNGQQAQGNALGPTSGPASTRTLATPVTGAHGTSMILSAVINSNVNGGTATQATLGNSSGGTFIIGELPETDPNAANWGLQNSAGVYYSVNKPVLANAPTCLVAQIDFSVGGPGTNDRMRLWINPPNPLSLALPADIDTTTAHIPVFSGVFWQTQQAQVVDEISVNSGGGMWTKLKCLFPGCQSDATLLLTDGTVLVLDGCSRTDWYKLTPDMDGSYVKGTWSPNSGPGAVASLPASWNYTPQFFGSAVLRDGRVIIEGGEHNMFPNGAIYDPVANTWTFVPAPGFGDSCGLNGTSWCSMGGPPTVVLPDGTFMIGDADYVGPSPVVHVTPASSSEALLPPPYNVFPNSWIPTGFVKHDPNSEEGWTLLPSPPGFPDLALVLDVNTYAIAHGSSVCGGYNSSELYIGGSFSGTLLPGDWYCLGNTPDQLYPGYNEMGPAVLRPGATPASWTVFQAGATQYTAILGANFAWNRGPGFPIDSSGKQLRMEDGPAALLLNGNVLMMAAPGQITGHVTFLELTPDPSNVLLQVPGVSYSTGLFGNAGEMLVLPTGQVMFIPHVNSPYGSGIEIYTPNNMMYNSAWAPTISPLGYPKFLNAGAKNLLISGTQFNGMSQATAFGDEYQNATNYPLVRLTDGSGDVFYLRTHGHSTMAVATGSAQVSTNFDVSLNVPVGTYCLEVVANGIPSPRVCGVLVQAPTPLTQISTTASGLAYSRVTQTFNGTVTIKNISSSAIAGPFQIVFTGLTAGVTLANAVGSFGGSSYLTVSSVSLAPSQSATVKVQFSGPTDVAIHFTPVIY